MDVSPINPLLFPNFSSDLQQRNQISKWLVDKNYGLSSIWVAIVSCSVLTQLVKQNTLEFTVKRIMIKLFFTCDIGIINICMSFFGFATVSELIGQCKK